MILQQSFTQLPFQDSKENIMKDGTMDIRYFLNISYSCHMQVHLSGNYITAVKSPSNIQACLPWWPPFSQHVLWQCCNHLGILSSMAEILLSNSVFHEQVTPISVSTLKPLLGVIKVLLLKL